MYKNVSKKIIAVIAVAAVIGIGSYAYADMGGGYGHRGYGRHHMYDTDEGSGYGSGQRGYGRGFCPGYYGDDLTKEDIEKLQAEREAFDEGTRKLRQNIYQKELSLESELAKEKPDAKKALKIQKEISDIRAQIDQKEIEYMIKVGKIAPNSRMGMMRGYGHMSGGGWGMMMGPGSGDAPCWR